MAACAAGGAAGAEHPGMALLDVLGAGAAVRAGDDSGDLAVFDGAGAEFRGARGEFDVGGLPGGRYFGVEFADLSTAAEAGTGAGRGLRKCGGSLGLPG